MDRLRAKSLLLTGYLEFLLRQELSSHCEIFTPTDPAQRGAQLSLSFNIDMDEALKLLGDMGVMCDLRRPSCIRVAPTPLYNSFSDVYEFVNILKSILMK
jgi:kynureninase